MARTIAAIAILATSVAAPARAEVTTVSAFLANGPSLGPAELIGYVFDIHACPPCPAGAQCKPCEGDLIRVADAAGPAGGRTLTILCRAAELSQFQIGQRYRITADVRAIVRPLPFSGAVYLRSAGPETAP